MVFKVSNLKLLSPAWINSITNQVFLPIVDGSPSMSEKQWDQYKMIEEYKYIAANEAIKGLFSEIIKPENKDGFWAGAIEYSTDARIITSVEKATVLMQKGLIPQINPVSDGLTNITGSLELAIKMLQEFEKSQSGGKLSFLQPVVMLFTDGIHNEGPEPYDAAVSLKNNATLVTVGFGDDGINEDLLRTIATSPQHYYRCRNGTDLRQFLASIGKTLTYTLTHNKNATAELGNINFQKST